MITCTVDAVDLITSQGVMKLMGRYRVELTNNPEVGVELMTCQEVLKLGATLRTVEMLITCTVDAVELITSQWRGIGLTNNPEIDVRPAKLNNHAGER